MSTYFDEDGKPVTVGFVEPAETIEVQQLRDRIAALTAERDAAQELATRSTRRLVELSEPGSIGAFAARDMAMERAARMQRERDANARDAARLRWLISHFKYANDTDGEIWVSAEVEDSSDPKYLLALIDSALKDKP